MATLVSNAQATKDRLVADLRSLVEDADELVRMSASYSGDRVAGARERLGEKLTEMRSLVERAQGSIAGHGSHAARQTHQYVQRYPWRSLGIAVGVGVAIGLLGMLSSRRY
jgi:ElaB/YqjD/DUF883 family membrane-anchored ribosome-binding protein